MPEPALSGTRFAFDGGERKPLVTHISPSPLPGVGGVCPHQSSGALRTCQSVSSPRGPTKPLSRVPSSLLSPVTNCCCPLRFFETLALHLVPTTQRVCVGQSITAIASSHRGVPRCLSKAEGHCCSQSITDPRRGPLIRSTPVASTLTERLPYRPYCCWPTTPLRGVAGPSPVASRQGPFCVRYCCCTNPTTAPRGVCLSLCTLSAELFSSPWDDRSVAVWSLALR